MRLEGAEPLDRRLMALRSGKAHKKILGQWAALGVKFAKRKVPRKTGKLGNTIRIGTVDAGRQTATILAGGTKEAGYAAFVEFGTGPHVIVPRRAKVLAWGGPRRLSGNLKAGAKATHFALKVNHKGSRAKPYLDPGAKQALRDTDMADGIIATWNEAA